jgi:hypothetical protein
MFKSDHVVPQFLPRSRGQSVSANGSLALRISQEAIAAKHNDQDDDKCYQSSARHRLSSLFLSGSDRFFPKKRAGIFQKFRTRTVRTRLS